MVKPESEDSIRLALGTAQLGFNYGIANVNGKPSLKQAREILQTALANGITMFDTAQAYGESEAAIGKCTKKSQKGKLKIITKLGPNFRIDDTDAVVAAVRESLTKLGISRLFGLLLHRAEQMKMWNDGGLKTVKKLKGDGLIEHFGVTMSYHMDEISSLMDISDVKMFQLPFNIWDRRAYKKGIISAAKDRTKIVFIRSIFLQGLAFMDDLPPRLLLLRPLQNQAKSFCLNRKISLPHFCLQYALSRCPDAVVVIGAETSKQVIENIRLCQNTLPIEIFNEWEKTCPEFTHEQISPYAWPAQ
jgi:aryl-alcohol dehydrogenase-like predicted oxidoreductase